MYTYLQSAHMCGAASGFAHPQNVTLIQEPHGERAGRGKIKTSAVPIRVSLPKLS